MEAETGYVCNDALLTLVSMYFKAKWPGAILSLDSGERRPLDTIKALEVPPGKAFVIYQDQKALDQFEKVGWVKKTSEKSILFWHIVKDDGLDLSFGEEDRYNWVEEFMNNLHVNNLFLKRVDIENSKVDLEDPLDLDEEPYRGPFSIGDTLQFMSLEDQLKEAISLNDKSYIHLVKELISYQKNPEAISRKGGVFKLMGTKKYPWGLRYILHSEDGIKVKALNLKGFIKLHEKEE